MHSRYRRDLPLPPEEAIDALNLKACDFITFQVNYFAVAILKPRGKVF